MILNESKKLLLSSGRGTPKPQDMFATTLRTGTGNRPRVVNNLDLLGKGGLVWAKDRNNNGRHFLVDTVRGASNFLSSETSNLESRDLNVTPTFYSDGFEGTGFSSGTTVVEWSFRRARKFFDVVTYTGDGTSNRQIPHSLGIVPGMIIVKNRSSTGNWLCYHRGLGINDFLFLNDTASRQTSNGFWGTVTSNSFGLSSVLNTSNNTYVAYVFAQNPDLIDCGSYFGGGTQDVSNTTGWKPQFLIVKNTTSSGDWFVIDSKRNSGDNEGVLYSNSSVLEQNRDSILFSDTTFTTKAGGGLNDLSQKYIYVAIRAPI